jgi:hypothetical protein
MDVKSVSKEYKIDVESNINVNETVFKIYKYNI